MSEGLKGAAIAALGGIEGLGVYDRGPVQAVWPYAEVDAASARDWGYKGGTGREVRLAVAVRDKGERPGRVQALLGAVESAVLGIGAEAVPGWRIVSLAFVRTRMARSRGEWAGVVEFRVRMVQPT